MKNPDRDSLDKRLTDDAPQFDFFQAVRLLVRQSRQNASVNGSAPPGEDSSPAKEAVRFRSSPTLSFAAAPIQSIKPPADGAPAEMTVTFMGLTGPSGALPHHYTSTVIEQERNRDPSMRAFFDLFHHRLVSHFYRAWEKYRFPTAYERTRLGTSGHDRTTAHTPWNGTDPFTSALMCLVGLGNRGHQGRLNVGEELLLFYAGQYSRRPRSAGTLATLLTDCFGVTTEVLQFHGRWLPLEEADRSRLGRPDGAEGYCTLGRSLVLGRQVWECQSRFRIRLGPLTYDQFCKFLPGSEGLRQATELTRMYAGAEFDFDVEPVLLAAERPRSRLGRKGGGRLGANFWLSSGPAAKDFDKRAFVSKAT
ncbi:MAG TPA: type VI secretion system baseplate subunit TssG [Tepidisphaeraceae bacterium]|jgi:type VI secretion system protein ImpH